MKNDTNNVKILGYINPSGDDIGKQGYEVFDTSHISRTLISHWGGCGGSGGCIIEIKHKTEDDRT